MKFRFAFLLPILIIAAALYEFYAQGFSINGSVNKLLLGIVYGFLLYIVTYIVKVIGFFVLNRAQERVESDRIVS